jgi:hypothetical protein
MLNYKPLKARRKPTDTEKATYDTEYNLQDGTPQVDDQHQEQDYKYTKLRATQVCFTDIDLAGLIETRQSASGLMISSVSLLAHLPEVTPQKRGRVCVVVEEGDRHLHVIVALLVGKQLEVC